MIYTGIDFSLNSPGTCTQDSKGKYTFITFFNYGNRIWDDGIRKIPKSFSVHKELMDDKTSYLFLKEMANGKWLNKQNSIDFQNLKQ